MSVSGCRSELNSTNRGITDYARAAQMLQPERYPEDFPPLAKLELLKEQATLLGLEENFQRVPQTTRFENGPNFAGVVSQTQPRRSKNSNIWFIANASERSHRDG